MITIRSHRAVAVIEVHFAYQAAGGGIDAFLLDAVGKAVEQLHQGSNVLLPGDGDHVVIGLVAAI